MALFNPYSRSLVLCQRVKTFVLPSQRSYILNILKRSGNDNSGSCSPLCYIEQMYRNKMFSQPIRKCRKIFVDKQSLLVIQNGLAFPPRKFKSSLRKTLKYSEIFKSIVPEIFVRSCIGLMLVMAVNAAVVSVPSCKSVSLMDHVKLFHFAWRTIDRAYIDKTFNGPSWFRYREDALWNEPMNTRQETYAAIEKMLATLDDTFTHFLKPEKFKSLWSGTQNALTGVGLSIGYPTGKNESAPGLVVISASPGGPANRPGISSGDIILQIDNTSTGNMGIYDAAERLQTYAEDLRKQCPAGAATSSVTVKNDPQRPQTFDNQYYNDLIEHKGLFQSDSVLFNDVRTKERVMEYANDQNEFFRNWSRSFVRLSVLGVKSGEDGEVRASCSTII